MKTLHRIALLALASLFVACQTTGADRAAAMVDSMRELQNRLNSGQEDITAAVDALQEVAKPGVDMRATFDRFTDAVDRLEQQSDRVKKLRQDIDRRRKGFVDAWEKQQATITNESLRERAAERRDEAVAAFEAINEIADETRDVFDAWMVSVRDIRTYLDNDLNPAGVANVTDVIEEVSEGAEPVLEQLEELNVLFDELNAALAAASPAPASTDG